MEFLSKVAVGVAVALLVTEMLGGLRVFARWLVKISAARLPHPLRERFIEEQYADLQDIRGPVALLINAIGTCWAAWQVKQSLIKEGLFQAQEQDNVSATVDLPPPVATQVVAEIMKAEGVNAFRTITIDEMIRKIKEYEKRREAKILQRE